MKGSRAGNLGWLRKDAAADEEMEEMLPQTVPTVSYVDIPSRLQMKVDRCAQSHTPPQSPVNSNVREPLDHL